jgi:hypothetical protein
LHGRTGVPALEVRFRRSSAGSRSGAIFLVTISLSILIVAKWDGLGSASVTLRREYVSIIVCALFAWPAAYLPFGMIQAL